MKFLKKHLFKSIVGMAAMVTTIHIIHALTLDRVIQYVEVPFHSDRLPPELDGYRIAFISDAHYISTMELREIVTRLNTENIDLLLLGGDNPINPHKSWNILNILSYVNTTDGIFGVEGNHDRREYLFPAMLDNGITPLFNHGQYPRPNLFIAGTSCMRRVYPVSASIERAVENAQPDDFVILLTHQPDIVMRQSTQGVDLILSGHTHGGEITFFGKWAPALTFTNTTQYGHRFMSGWAKSRDNTPIYVTNGIGNHAIRMFARPQVVIITLGLP